jgi:hypothetical protein
MTRDDRIGGVATVGSSERLRTGIDGSLGEIGHGYGRTFVPNDFEQEIDRGIASAFPAEPADIPSGMALIQI